MGKTIFNYIIHFEEIRGVDWMSGHRMENAARWKVGTRFLNNPTGEEIWLRIDDGNMGGGGGLTSKPTLSENEFEDMYNLNYNGDTGFTQSRKGKFHYCVFADEIWTGRTGKCFDDRFVVADGHGEVGSLADQSATFMHELGHSLGLHSSDFEGIDNDDSDKPWEEDYDKYENYKSCMNYRYQTDWGTTQCIIDYSDGTHGENDHDDWGNLNLGENL